jgi:hypothetical protein
MEINAEFNRACFTEKRWRTAVQCFFYTAPQHASGPGSSSMIDLFLPKTEALPITQIFRFYSSSSPPSLSMYFDRISFHCRCTRVSVHTASRLTSEKLTPLFMLSQILSVTVSYALLYPSARGSLSAGLSQCGGIHLESERRRKDDTEEDVVLSEEEAKTKIPLASDFLARH